MAFPRVQIGTAMSKLMFDGSFRKWGLAAAFGMVAVLAVLWLMTIPTATQTPGYKAPRTADGKPNLNGIWQAVNTANWDIQDHPARQGPVQFGALFSAPAGSGVVEGDTIPYQPWAAMRKKENVEKRYIADPELKCYLPGVPRATYMPFPFQIAQTSKYILMTYEFAGAARIVYMDSGPESPADVWMGHSLGRWDGD